MTAQRYSFTEDSDGRVGLVVPDTELWDFFDDFFTEEVDLEPEFLSRQPLTHWFPIGVSKIQLEAAIAQIDPLEIERIWRLNNSDPE